MFVALFAADVGFIGLDLTLQREYIASHGRPNARTHVPRGFIRAAPDHPMDLQGTHSFLAGKHQEAHREPFAEWIVSILKNRPRNNAEPITVFAACRDLAGLFAYAFLAALAEVMERPRLKGVCLIATSRTLDNTIRPTLLGEKRPTCGLIRKPAE